MASDSIHILITGADGQLGQAFRQIKNALPQSYHFTFTGRKTLDLTNSEAVQKKLQSTDYCINCAAYTAVDRAEEEKETAFAINAEAVKHLAKACKQNNAKLIHFSTDYVYDSGQAKPYLETDPVHPRSIYAQSKLLGEKYALQEQQDTIILRTSWLFSTFGKNFYTSMLRLGRERETLGVVYDQIGTPTSTLHLAKAVLHIIQKIEQGLPAWQGIYNFSNEGVASWYDFAHEIMRLHQLRCRLYPIRTEAFPRPAPRPAFSLMDKSKICSTFALDIQHWTEAVEELKNTHVE